jgi:hypothetical protein
LNIQGVKNGDGTQGMTERSRGEGNLEAGLELVLENAAFKYGCELYRVVDYVRPGGVDNL